MYAHHLDTSEIGAGVQQEVARVVAVAGDDFILRSGTTYRARRAHGCLVAPEADDEVLVALAGEHAFIVCVLVREGNATTLSVSGDLRLCTPNGRLQAIAARGLDLACSRGLQVTAEDVEVQALRARVVSDEVRTVARTIESVAETVTLSAARCLRRIDELDQLRARVIDHAAEGLMRLHSRTTLMKATLLAKIDGGQIHMG